MDGSGKPGRLKLGGPIARGERTGPGFEGVSCPSCGALCRIPAGSDGLMLECGCGSVFQCAALRIGGEGPPQDKPEASPAQTLFVHKGGSPRQDGAGAPLEAPQSPGDAPTLTASPAPAGGRGRRAMGIPDTITAEPAGAAAAPSRRIGKYEIIEEIARGGMGVVYRARQEGLNREVALKMLLAGEGASEDQIRRFMREAESAAALSHPNIVKIFDVGQDMGRHFYAMEFIHGESVAQVIKRMSVIPPRQALKIMRDVALALEFAHEHGIIHRDVKPANIMLSPRQETVVLKPDKKGESVVFSSGASTTYQVIVTDFGLAKDMSEGSVLTVSGTALGTPVYMSPEQADGDLKKMGPRSDVYSMGAVLYEMVTGREPFSGSSVGQVLAKVLSEEPLPPRKARPGLHRDIETMIQTAMAKDRDRRYSGARAFAEDIERFLAGEHIQARPASLVYRAAKKIRRNKLLSASVVLFAVVLAALGVWARISAMERETAVLNRVHGLVADAGKLEMKKKYLEAEQTYAKALGLIEGFPPAAEGLRAAKLSRLLGNTRDLLKESQFKAAGMVLDEAKLVAPEDPEVRRLSRVQAGTAVLSVASAEQGLDAYFAPAGELGLLLLPEAAPDPEAGLEAGIYERLGPLPYGPADRPFGDGYLVLARGGQIVDSFYVSIPRLANVAVDRKRLRVDAAGGGDCRSIQEAINRAGPGSTIEVSEGRYEENLFITKPGLTIRAAAGARPEVGQGESGLRISADGLWGLRIQGFSFKVAEGAAVSIMHAPGAVFAGNRVSGGTDRSVVMDGRFMAIWGNEITDCKEPGIAMYSADFSVFANNKIMRAGWTGVLLDSGMEVSMARNISDSNARVGFWIGGNGKGSCRVFENVARGNRQWGFLFDKVGVVHVRDNFAADTFSKDRSIATGISIQEAKGGSVEHNTVHHNIMGADLVFADLPFRDNILSGNTLGMHWHGSQTVDYNCFWGNKTMMQWEDKDANSIKEIQKVYDWKSPPPAERMAHGLEADPKFRDPEKGDFGLAEGSPCIGSASDGGNMGADWEKIRSVIEGRFDAAEWFRDHSASRCVSAADAEERRGDSAAAAALLRKALAFRPGDAALAKRIAELGKKQGP